MLHIHWKGNNFYYSFIFCKTISCHTLLFWEAFSCHFQHVCILAKHLATYPIHIRFICLLLPTLWPTFPHHLGAKNIKVQPSSNDGLKGKPWQYALISMLSCIQKTKLGFLGLSTYLGTYPSFYKLSPNSTMAATYAQVSFQKQNSQNCAQMPLRHFTEHLVGAPLGMQKWGMGAMWHAQLLQNAP